MQIFANIEQDIMEDFIEKGRIGIERIQRNIVCRQERIYCDIKDFNENMIGI